MIVATKITKTVFYTRSLSRPNRFGQVETANSRKEVSWSARTVDGKHRVDGFGTRRDAIAAVSQIGAHDTGKPT